MLPRLLRPQVPADVSEEFVIALHHPDRLGRPAAKLGAMTDDRFHQALTWNVFRTLELLTPAFWLRRFHLRATGSSSGTAPQVLRISLWRSLRLPPIQRIDGGQPDVLVDVIVETEHAVWSLIVARHVDEANVGDQVSQVIDAGGWLAGTREHYVGIIERESDAGVGESLRRRYARSSASLELRSPSRGPARPRLDGMGTVRWKDLAAILRDCQHADNLPDIERALARNALMWLQSVGIETAASPFT